MATCYRIQQWPADATHANGTMMAESNSNRLGGLLLATLGAMQMWQAHKGVRGSLKGRRIADLASWIERADQLDPELQRIAYDAIGWGFPDRERWIRTGLVVDGSAESVFQIARRVLPQGVIQLEGDLSASDDAHESAFVWRCTVVDIELNPAGDVAGVAYAPMVALAVLAALLRVGLQRRKTYRL